VVIRLLLNAAVSFPINDIIKKRVVQQWLGGEARDKIASNLQIGEGTVSGIVSEFKIGLENSEFDSIRQLALEIRKQQLSWPDLSSHFRLSNFIKSSASEDKAELFITNVSSDDVPPERIIELVNQLHDRLYHRDSIAFMTSYIHKVIRWVVSKLYWQQPQLFSQEVRAGLRPLRK
jgi:hypothetical protein